MLAYLALSCLVLSCLVLCCLVLSLLCWFVFSYLVLSCVVICCLVLSCIALSDLVLSCLDLTCLCCLVLFRVFLFRVLSSYPLRVYNPPSASSVATWLVCMQVTRTIQERYLSRFISQHTSTRSRSITEACSHYNICESSQRRKLIDFPRTNTRPSNPSWRSFATMSSSHEKKPPASSSADDIDPATAQALRRGDKFRTSFSGLGWG